MAARWSFIMASLAGLALPLLVGASPAATLSFQRGATPEEKASALQKLLGAQQAARSDKPLPFQLVCTDPEGPGTACADGGRQALAGMPLEKQSFPVFSPPEGYEMVLPFGAGDGFSWTVKMQVGETITRIALHRSRISFH
jgi:hypothetical protein